MLARHSHSPCFREIACRAYLLRKGWGLAEAKEEVGPLIVVHPGGPFPMGSPRLLHTHSFTLPPDIKALLCVLCVCVCVCVCVCLGGGGGGESKN